MSPFTMELLIGFILLRNLPWENNAFCPYKSFCVAHLIVSLRHCAPRPMGSFPKRNISLYCLAEKDPFEKCGDTHTFPESARWLPRSPKVEQPVVSCSIWPCQALKRVMSELLFLPHGTAGIKIVNAKSARHPRQCSRTVLFGVEKQPNPKPVQKFLKPWYTMYQ